jgi:hypothetical protein
VWYFLVSILFADLSWISAYVVLSCYEVRIDIPLTSLIQPFFKSLSHARRNFQSSYCRYLFCQERRFDYILSLIFVSCEKEHSVVILSIFILPRKAFWLYPFFNLCLMREGTFNRHTVDIYFAKKGVLTISFL